MQVELGRHRQASTRASTVLDVSSPEGGEKGGVEEHFGVLQPPESCQVPVYLLQQAKGATPSSGVYPLWHVPVHVV